MKPIKMSHHWSTFGTEGSLPSGVWDTQWSAGEKHLGSVQVVYEIFRWEELRVEKRGMGGFGEEKHGKMEVKCVNRQLIRTLIWPCSVPEQHCLSFFLIKCFSSSFPG